MKKRFLTVLFMLATLLILSPAALAVDLTAGGTIVLTEDVKLEEGLTIKFDTVLDLGGHTITGKKEKTDNGTSMTTISVGMGANVSIRNGTLKNVLLCNYGTITDLSDVEITGGVRNTAGSTIHEIRRCSMTGDVFTLWNYGHIDLIDNCEIIARENFSALRNEGVIDLADHCYVEGAQRIWSGFGLGCHEGSVTTAEDSIFVGSGHGGIRVTAGTLTAKDCVIVNTHDTLGEGSIAMTVIYPEQTPEPVLESCTLIATQYPCGSVKYDADGEWYYDEHADMEDCDFITLSEADLDDWLDWKMEKKPPVRPTASGLANFKTVNTYTAGQFADVASTYWGAPNIAKAYELGLMKGSSDTAFDPEGSVTVAQTVTMAARLHSIYATGSENFVQSGVWYQTYVDYCKANGILKKDFADYNAPAKRSDFAAILAAALPAEALSAINTVTSIPDVAENGENGETIYALYRAGILTGNDAQGTFGPETSINRAAAAAILTRMADISLRKNITL